MAGHHDAAGEYALQCMEIWGSSGEVQSRVATPGLDAWVFSRPYSGATDGGDVHYLSLCGGGIITRLIVADVSGHGQAVAEFSRELRRLVRRYINTKSQTRLVAELNRQFTELAESRRFATAVVATYLASQRRLTVCNAGHPRPLRFDAAAGTWSVLNEDTAERDPNAQPLNLPLGFDEATPYDQFVVRLGLGDVLVFFTDALTEASDAAGHLLGEEGLRSLAAGLDPADPERLGRDLLAAVDRHRGGRPTQDDDVTLMVLRHNGDGPRSPSLGEKLDVYAKVFGIKPV